MDVPTVLYPREGVFSAIKRNDLQIHDAEQKKPDMEENLMYDSIYMILWNRQRESMVTESGAVVAWGWDLAWGPTAK